MLPARVPIGNLLQKMLASNSRDCIHKIRLDRVLEERMAVLSDIKQSIIVTIPPTLWMPAPPAPSAIVTQPSFFEIEQSINVIAPVL